MNQLLLHTFRESLLQYLVQQRMCGQMKKLHIM